MTSAFMFEQCYLDLAFLSMALIAFLDRHSMTENILMKMPHMVKQK